MEKDTLSDDREDFKCCLDHEAEQRKVSQDDLEFGKLEKQWDERDVSQRKEDGRPCLTINRLPSFMKQVTNDARINRPSINVKPVGSGADKQTADIQSDIIRNIETQSQAPAVYDTAFDFAVSCGFGYFRVNVDYACEDEWDQDIMLERISNPFSVFGDYEGKEATSIDWNRCYVTDWYSKSAFESRWGKNRETADFEDGSGDYDANWFKDKRIRVAERWLREQIAVRLVKTSNGAVMYADEWLKNQELFVAQGIQVVGERDSMSYKVKQRLITGKEILEENDWLGKYIPIIPMYGEEVNVNGKRHFISLIRRAKDAQRAFNYWRTVCAELGALQPKAPFIGAVGQFNTDAAMWQTANRVSHAYLQYDVVDGAPPPQRQMFAGVPAGAMQESLNAVEDMKSIMGLHDASLGARSNETSGKAIMARQREGDVSTYDFIDNRNKSVEHGGRVILDLIPQVYTAERILRGVQEDGATYAVPVNQPVVQRQQLDAVMGMMGPQQPPAEPMPMPAMPAGPRPMPPMPQQAEPSDGPPQFVPVTQEMQSRMSVEQIEQLKAVTRVFDLTAGKYDVVVTAGPGFTTRREEAATQMMEFIRVFPQAAPLIGDLLAKNLDWPGSEQVAERLKAMLPPQAAGKINPMVQQLQGMLQQQDAMAKQAVATLQKQLADVQQQLKDKSGELEVKRFEAETDRIQAVKTETPPSDPLEAQRLAIQAEETRIKAFEAETKRIEVEAKAQEVAVQTAALHMERVEVPQAQIAQNTEQFQAVISAMQALVEQAGAQRKPRRKTGRAIKDPQTGVYTLESVEEDIDLSPPLQ